jgi:phytanoyl-CoA hydroxylase
VFNGGYFKRKRRPRPISDTHKLDFVEHGYPEWKEGVNKGYWGTMKIPDEKIYPKVYPEMKAGDVVFFHPHLIHGSG